jgi:putative flavoprotein involved in K+ transport
MPAEEIDTLVIGGGQAGLAMSYRLKQRGRSHLVLERGRIAERWRSERWDGLKFQFPNWSVRLPDFQFQHRDPDGFASSGEIVDFVCAYAAFVAPPIRCGVEVKRLRRGDGVLGQEIWGLVAETSDGVIAANNVVVATGPYQRPVVPALLGAQGIDGGIFQVHASRYKNPAQLPDGAVLVVGAGASGAQIAEELNRAGRRVYLSLGQHGRMPRRYRGRDLVWWFGELGLFQMLPEQRGPIRVHPVITGAYGGYTVDFRRFAADGMTLLGQVKAAGDGAIDLAPGLATDLANGDGVYTAFLDMADAHVLKHALELPDDPEARAMLPDPPGVSAPLRRLDLRASGITSVVWATGYGVDFGWIDIPILNARGEPVHVRGITAVPGLYFLGLAWLSNLNSSFLSGVGDDAAELADHIAARG